jgi:SAM-dependent methyltransferase
MTSIVQERLPVDLERGGLVDLDTPAHVGERERTEQPGQGAQWPGAAVAIIKNVLFEDRARAESFGAVAQTYDRARPSYPPAMLDALLADGARAVLDVGCGTGIAGALLASRGCEVLGVEVDPRMAAMARRKGLDVEIASFETWDDRGRRFDLLICAQAWHWIDPGIGAVKAAGVLSDGGRIGCFWNFGDLPPQVRERLAPVYARLAPELENYAVVLGNHGSRIETTEREIANSGRFETIEVLVFPWSKTYRTGEWLEHVSTHSDHHALAVPALDELLAAVGSEIDSLGGSFEMPYETMLVTARRG